MYSFFTNRRMTKIQTFENNTYVIQYYINRFLILERIVLEQAPKKIKNLFYI